MRNDKVLVCRRSGPVPVLYAARMESQDAELSYSYLSFCPTDTSLSSLGAELSGREEIVKSSSAKAVREEEIGKTRIFGGQ